MLHRYMSYSVRLSSFLFPTMASDLKTKKNSSVSIILKQHTAREKCQQVVNLLFLTSQITIFTTCYFSCGGLIV